MSEEVYAIVDLHGYVNEMRRAAANTLVEGDENSEENLDEFISIGQMINIINKECVGFDDKDRPLLNEECNERIYENTVTWIHNVGLAKLAAQDLIECAWDNDSNEMVFWPKVKINNNVKQRSKKTRRNKKT